MRMRSVVSLLALLLVSASVLVGQKPRARRSAAPPAVLKWELGADFVAAYTRESLNGEAQGAFAASAPFDIRIGRRLSGANTVELRGGLSYNSEGAPGGGAAYAVSPGLNFTHAFAGGTVSRGHYLTLGAGALINHTGTTVTQASVNAGIGTRWKLFRGELFVSNVFKNTGEEYPNELSAGVRLGLDLWK